MREVADSEIINYFDSMKLSYPDRSDLDLKIRCAEYFAWEHSFDFENAIIILNNYLNEKNDR